MHWDEMVQAALQGADESGLSDSLLKHLQDRGIDISRELTEVLLDGVAMYALEKRAAFPFHQVKGVESKPSDVSSSQSDQAVVALFQKALKKPYQDALPELLSLMIEGDISVPPEFLPALLEQCGKQGTGQAAAEELLGQRAAWLAKNNPEWIAFAHLEEARYWENGSWEEQLAFLRFQRRKKAGFGSEEVLARWKKATPAQKRGYLLAFQDALSHVDIPFLEQALEDGRKEVRRQAAVSLLRHPESPLSQHWRRLLAASFDAQRGDLLGFPSPDPLSVRYGLVSEGDLADAQEWFFLMIRQLSPSSWRLAMGADPDFFSVVLAKANQGDGFFRKVAVNLLEAALLHEDRAWAETFFVFWMEDGALEAELQEDQVQKMLALVEPRLFNKVLLESPLLKKFPEGKKTARLVQALTGTPHFWVDLLARRVFDPLLEGTDSIFAGTFSGKKELDFYSMYKLLLKQGAFRINPSFFDAYTKALSNGSGVGRLYPVLNEVRTFLEVLSFRKEMRQKLSRLRQNQNQRD